MFFERLAHYYCEFNVAHPFREGNGRTQRVLFENLAINAGYAVRWKFIDPAAWIPANIAAYMGNLDRLIHLFKLAFAQYGPDST